MKPLTEPPDGPAWRRVVRYAWQAGLATIALIGVIEVTLTLVLANAPESGNAGDAIRQYYSGYERRLIQMLPECAQWDSITTYRLRPGSCRFHNFGFDNTVTINSAGFRGTETSLQRPEIVVIGDSYAMGWGVPDDSTLAVQLEQRTGRRTLNMGTSSWATARELLALGRADLSAARYLVIQYSDNDIIENEAFVRDEGRLTILPRARYDSLAQLHAATLGYRPGRRFRRLTPILIHAMMGRVEVDTVQRRPEQHVEAFLGTLARSPVSLDSVQILVTHMSREERIGNFRELLETRAREPHWPPWIRNLKVVRVTPAFSYAERFPYDLHLRSNAYTRVADALASAMAGSAPADQASR